MKPALILRIAFAFVLMELAGHTWLVFSYVPKHGIEEVAVIAAMKSREFSFSGSHHTYWDLYFGYELFVSLSLLVEAAILWQVAKSSVRSVVGILALGEAGYAILMSKYFFIIPIAGHTLMAILLAAAWFRLPAGPAPSSLSAVPLPESPAPLAQYPAARPSA
jgi:hypothetical protein